MSDCDCCLCCDSDPEGDDEFDPEDDSVSTFGKLPPAPSPRVFSSEQIGEQVDKFFGRYGQSIKIYILHLQNVVAEGLKISPHEVRSTHEQVRDYVIAASQPGGWLSMTKGRNGGISKVGERPQSNLLPPTRSDIGSIPDTMKRPSRETETITVKAIPIKQKEKPCRNCGRNNDIGVHKCWNCECSSP